MTRAIDETLLSDKALLERFAFNWFRIRQL